MILPFMVAFHWFNWLKDDTAETTAKVVTWMRILFFYVAITGLIFVIAVLSLISVFVAIFNPNCDDCGSGMAGTFAAPLILNYILQTFFTWYFYNATKRYYADRHESFTSAE